MDLADQKQTPLFEQHVAAGARMVPFAGYAMPVQYAHGVLKEHIWTRTHAGLFDVSHMGQARLTGMEPFAAFERMTPGDFVGLPLGRQRYSLLLNAKGGVKDDLMAGRPDTNGLFIVVNGACKDKDFAFIRESIDRNTNLDVLSDRALLALQGPEALAVLQAWVPQAAAMRFMDIAVHQAFGVDLILSRSGYTGEDGFELSIPAGAAADVWADLLKDARVRPIGLGARDSLRLEAGLPLYGQDLDETVSPVEADLTFAVAKSRQQLRDFPGAGRIVREAASGPSRRRVALLVEGAPARAGAGIADGDGHVIGQVTSGGYSPSLERPIALGFVPPSFTRVGQALQVVVRGRSQPARVTESPFIPHRYVRTS